MNKYIGFLAAALLCLSIMSCNKQDFDYPEGTVGSSTITNYPILNVAGSYVIINKGSTYTDPGVTAKEGSNDLKVVTSGAVNANQAGVYTLTYTATNKDGFSASATRSVVVTAPDATAAANDFSGTYLRSATGQSAVFKKVAPGVYEVSNPGGAAGASGVVVLALNQTGYSLNIPTQMSSVGQISSTAATVKQGATAGTIEQFIWKINNSGYGTGDRTFVKQ